MNHFSCLKCGASPINGGELCHAHSEPKRKVFSILANFNQEVTVYAENEIVAEEKIRMNMYWVTSDQKKTFKKVVKVLEVRSEIK